MAPLNLKGIDGYPRATGNLANKQKAQVQVELGMQLHKHGNHEEAARHYRAAIKVDPNCLTALNLLSDIMLLAGNHARAEKLASQALKIRADMPGALLIRGCSRHAMGKLKPAIADLEHAVELKPDYVDALMALGRVLRDAGKADRSIDAYEKLLAQFPDIAEAHYNLANTFVSDGLTDEATEAYNEAIRLKPDFADAHANLAGALCQADRPDEALAAADSALSLDPDHRAAWINKGNALRALNRLTDAQACYQHCLDLNANDADAIDLMATVIQGQGRLDEARRLYRHAISLDPKSDMYKGDLSTALLAAGDLEDGWKMYESRFGAGVGTPKDMFDSYRRWRGQSLAGRTLLVIREQGIGDGGQCTIATNSRLVELFRRSFPEAEVQALDAGCAGIKADFAIAAGSLPQLFRSSVESFPAEAGYLRPDRARVAEFRSWLENLGDGLKVGFAWRSRNVSTSRTHHYTELDDWQALFGLTGIRVVNLQYGDVSGELNDASKRYDHRIAKLPGVDLMNDLDAAAALTASVDLVISPGTSVADMAGAVGVPALVYGSAFHPMSLGTDGLPWYPGVKYIARRWDQPIGEIVEQIVDMVRETAQTG